MKKSDQLDGCREEIDVAVIVKMRAASEQNAMSNNESSSELPSSVVGSNSQLMRAS